MTDSVAEYDIQGSTLLHQHSLASLLEEGLGQQEQGLGQQEQGGYSRSLCGGLAERSSSTIEIPDIDINAKFHLATGWIDVKKSEKFGSFLYEIKVVEGRKEAVDQMVLQMQYHGLKEEPQGKQKGLDKSYVKRKEGTFLSSHVARWQLIGVIKSMRRWGLEVSDSSRLAAEVGLLNGVYNVMVYDSSVCRRGILRQKEFRKVLQVKMQQMKGVSQEQKLEMEDMVEQALCFHPTTGIQVDYTAGFHISEDAVPEEAKRWTKRKGEWPSPALVRRVMRKGAHLVPKAFTEDTEKNEKSRRWRINFDLNEIIMDPDYSKTVDPRRVLIILKDIKNGILPQSSTLVKSYFLKVAIARAMLKGQENRAKMTDRDLLVASMAELQLAYQKMRLPDFFNSKFNHLHRKRERLHEAVEIAKKIGNTMEDIDSVLWTLSRKQKEFREEQDTRVGRALILLEEGSRPDTGRWVQQMRRLVPRLDRSSLAQLMEWMKNKNITALRRPGQKVGIGEVQPAGQWQDVIRGKYQLIFSEKDSQVEGMMSMRRQPDSLSLQILESFLSTHETFEITRQKLKIWEELSDILENKLDVKLAPFGSSFNLLGLQGCDLDLALYPGHDEKISKVALLEETLALLTSAGVVGESSSLVKARVPVLHLTHSPTGLALDLVVEVGDPRPVRVSHLLLHCALHDWRVRPLLVAVRAWARGHRVNSALEHSFSSHVLNLLTVHYLQVTELSLFDYPPPSPGRGVPSSTAQPAGHLSCRVLSLATHGQFGLHRQVPPCEGEEHKLLG